MSEPFLGEIMIVAFPYAPRGWAFCDGKKLAIRQNQGLYALLGRTYGGDGVNDFMLPDLRARIPVHRGSLNGTTVALGEAGGSSAVTILGSQVPAHAHLVKADSGNGTGDNPLGAYFATMVTGPADKPVKVNGYAAAATTSLIPGTIDSQGGNAPHSNVQPVLGLNYIIALAGVYPSRS
jgi:microcystin-dependent protein